MKTPKANINPFDVSRDELLNLAANKLVEQLCDTQELYDRAERLIHEKVETAVKTGLNARVDAFLQKEMTEILGATITPMTIWGEPNGQPTTIKAVLSERAAKFWNVNVGSDGRECSYGGSPRYEVLMQQMLKDQFAEAVKSNAEVIVSAFKQALTADAQRIVKENIEKLIKTK